MNFNTASKRPYKTGKLSLTTSPPHLLLSVCLCVCALVVIASSSCLLSLACQSSCRPGWSGIIQSAVSPSLEAKHTAAAVRSLCMRHLGAAPEIHIFGKDDATFTYVPRCVDLMNNLEVRRVEPVLRAC